jgi:hypothetical protein
VSARTDSETVIADYRAAYEAATGGPAPSVTYERGWFALRYRNGLGVQRYRGAQIINMTGALVARAAKQ